MKNSLTILLGTLLTLAACQKHTDGITRVEQIDAWTAQAIEQAKSTAVAPQPAAITQLFSNELPSTLNQNTFVTSDEPSNENQNNQPPQPIDALKLLTTETASSLAEPPTTQPKQNIHPTASSLDQATLSEISYQGLLKQNGQTWGIIEIGQRLYRVNSHDRIGKESWSVTQLTDQSLHLSAKSKRHTITKAQQEHR